jgi:hypothetical protein
MEISSECIAWATVAHCWCCFMVVASQRLLGHSSRWVRFMYKMQQISDLCNLQLTFVMTCYPALWLSQLFVVNIYHNTPCNLCYFIRVRTHVSWLYKTNGENVYGKITTTKVSHLLVPLSAAFPSKEWFWHCIQLITHNIFQSSVTSMVGCQVLAIDLRGHGDTVTTNEEDLSAETMARYL